MIQKDYKTDVEVFDEIEAQALAMSDMIAYAIVMQFFDQFKCPQIWYNHLEFSL